MDELKRIKKIYGEEFMHLCRKLFPTILENEGKLLEILEKKFARNCNSLYQAIIEQGLENEFKDFIYSFIDVESKKVIIDEGKSPYEILDEAGYTLYECQTEEEIQGFKKYYAPNEVLCTIYNGGRLNTDVCFWAVRKDVNEIKRKDFKNPSKTDEYSTSVLAIQFDRRYQSDVQIISRYNHTVNNPNCTLGNDLNNIAEGLHDSFAKMMAERNIHINHESEKNFEISGYTFTNDGKYYKYNHEIDGVYYCPGNIIIKQGEAITVGEPSETLLCDYFKIDMKNKSVECLHRTRRRLCR